MPGRKVPLITGETYHIFNRGIDKRPTFLNKRHYQRATLAINYYRFVSPFPRLGYFLKKSPEEQLKIFSQLNKSKMHVEISAYCLMPNHFHFCLRQTQEDGIAKFMSNFQNSYTRYFNETQQRVGPLFLDQFKAVRIEDEEQLLHLTRYIHLNPHTGFVVKTLAELEEYPWSSFREHLNKQLPTFCHTSDVLSSFKTIQSYKNFVFDQTDYQRTLKEVEHLLLENVKNP